MYKSSLIMLIDTCSPISFVAKFSIFVVNVKGKCQRSLRCAKQIQTNQSQSRMLLSKGYDKHKEIGIGNKKKKQQQKPSMDEVVNQVST